VLFWRILNFVQLGLYFWYRLYLFNWGGSLPYGDNLGMEIVFALPQALRHVINTYKSFLIVCWLSTAIQIRAHRHKAAKYSLLLPIIQTSFW
jgi:hypothetical protein